MGVLTLTAEQAHRLPAGVRAELLEWLNLCNPAGRPLARVSVMDLSNGGLPAVYITELETDETSDCLARIRLVPPSSTPKLPEHLRCHFTRSEDLL